MENTFWTDDDGHQIIKWSAGPYVTPMIDVLRCYVTTALGALGTLAKLFNTFRGGGTAPNDKAS